MGEPLISGRYRPLATLGEGGHGSVTLAFDTKMARRVALKHILLPAGQSGRRPVGLAEARTAALLNHPAIVTVHEWEPTPDGALIVMEYVVGASLADVLDGLGGPLDLDETAAVLHAVADAVSFGHANGVLHLDLKPENVLVDRRGFVKVADFGISVLTGADRSGRARGGTPGYMAPEQIRGEPVDGHTDQWALAALVYELLTGIAPFDAETPERSLVRIEHGHLDPPSRIARGLPAGVDLVLARALSPDPADRYPDVTAFAAAMLDHLGDPQAGRESLAEIVEDMVVEEEAAGRLRERWSGLANRRAWPARAGAAAICAWAGWVGVAPIAGRTAGGVAATLCALAAAISPQLGLALALIAVALGVGGAFGLAAGMAVALLGMTWWTAAARLSTTVGYAPVTSIVLAAVRAGAAVPLTLGLATPPVQAALGGAVAGAATAVVSSLAVDAPSAASLPFGFITDPWHTLDPARLRSVDLRLVLALGASWGLGALITSLGTGRGTRAGAVTGGIAGLVLIGAALYAFSPVSLVTRALDLAVAGAVALLAASLGSPIRD